MHRSRWKRLTYPAIGAALLTLSAWIAIPFPIPLTMQSFMLFFLLLLFRRQAVLSLFLYLLLGFLGLPVFAGFVGGFGLLLSPTGGFLLGFLPASLLFLLFSRRSRLLQVLGAAFSMILLYLCGCLFYAFVYGTGASGILPILAACVLPYLLPDFLKISLAFWLSGRLDRHFHI